MGGQILPESNMKNANLYLPEDILIPFFGKNAKIIGVEIGVLGGSGSSAMLERMPNLRLYCIDPWKHFEGRGYEAEKDQAFHDNNFEETKKRLKQFGERAIILRMTSDEADLVVKEKLDFVYIDGDHSEDQVRRDIINWKKKLKSRSILAGHDWQLDHIKKAVLELLGEPKLGDDFIWYFEYEG
ncbi:MAG: class I SAM-dependent methyltransferase [Candidatus Hodarchaeales archaeon]